jgi:hypothetical protein
MQAMRRQTEGTLSHSLVDVPVEHFPVVRPLVSQWIEEAAQASVYFTADDVWTALENRSAQLWLVWNETADAVCVTQLEPTSKGKHCCIWIMVGREMVSWLPLIAQLEQWAKREGCNMMRHEARPGWAKMLKREGYHMPHVILEKEL